MLDAPKTPRYRSDSEIWPDLPLDLWQDTYATLHCWMQIVGKIGLALSPMWNHWWQGPLYVTARGLTTSPIPYGTVDFQIDSESLRKRPASHYR